MVLAREQLLGRPEPSGLEFLQHGYKTYKITDEHWKILMPPGAAQAAECSARAGGGCGGKQHACRALVHQNAWRSQADHLRAAVSWAMAAKGKPAAALGHDKGVQQLVPLHRREFATSDQKSICYRVFKTSSVALPRNIDGSDPGRASANPI